MALSKITTESLLDGEITAAKFASGVGGKVVQVVNVTDLTKVAGTTTIPQDDTIPTSSEGFALFELAVTPTHASNKLHIHCTLNLNHTNSTLSNMACLFQDSGSAAIATTAHHQNQANAPCNLTLYHVMAAGTTSATTFKIRIGANSTGTVSTNASGTTRIHGGMMVCQMTITEIAV